MNSIFIEKGLNPFFHLPTIGELAYHPAVRKVLLGLCHNLFSNNIPSANIIQLCIRLADWNDIYGILDSRSHVRQFEFVHLYK
ncbi:hypothetical protein SAMN05216352_109168 [Alteribacillus bidgolensis]|uniref:Uncharacterized protein n=1 Tax=Alteribacillus bidgolensis TaxID=930129 RepID=A0A1G8M133_9BACI|nr:hypothetical protein SAMN05216352_109168 [Alteribacillus bidgolensis]